MQSVKNAMNIQFAINDLWNVLCAGPITLTIQSSAIFARKVK